MALQKQKVQLSITDGLDTKTDSKNVMPTKFLELENVVFTKTGSLSKSEGYTALNTNVFGGGSITSGSALSSFKDELLAYGNGNLYSRSEAENSWVNKGAAQQVITETSNILANNSPLRHPSMCYADNFIMYVTAQEQNNSPLYVNYKLVDQITGTELALGTLNGGYPSVEYFQGLFVIVYWDYVTKLLTVFKLNPSTLATSTTSFGATQVKRTFTIRTIGQHLYVGYALDSNNNLLLNFFDQSFTLGSPISLETTDSSAIRFICVAKENVDDVRITWTRDEGGGGYVGRTVCYSYGLNTAYADPIPLSTAGSTASLGKCYSVGFNGYSEIYYTYRTNATSSDVYLITVKTDNTGVSAPATVLNNAVMLLEPIYFNNQTFLFVAKAYPVSVNSHNRSTFIVDKLGNMVARFFEDATVLDEYDYYSSTTAFTRALNPGPRATIINSELFFVVPTLDAVTSGSMTQSNDFTKVQQGGMDFSATANYFDALLGDNLHIVGSILKMYDGQAVYEHSFVDPPGDLVLGGISNLGPPSPGTGTYQYRAVYAWKDAQGNLHRSRPSNALSVTLTTNQYPSIQVPCTPFTLKNNVEIELYRVDAANNTYNKLTGAGGYANVIYNNPALQFQIIIDQQTYAQISSNEILYTEGNTLENTAAQASKMSVVWRNRVVLLAYDGKSIQFSKLRGLNEPVEFADELVYPLDAIGGIGISLGVMDDNLIIFKETAIQYMSGQGPDNTGANDDFGRPSLITSDTGCLDPASVIQMPLGLMFKSEKGVYLLARGQSVGYIGAGVEAFNSLTVTSATLRTNTNEVRFTTADGRTLIYDYYHQRWTTLVYQQALDSLSKDGELYYIRADGTVLGQDMSFGNNGSPINSKLVTAWLSTGGIQGFQRFYRLLVLGNFKAEHKLLVKFAYDFNDAWVHEELVDAATLLSAVAYGEGAYGADEYGGQFPLYQFDIRPKIQKCQAFKISIEDVCPSGGTEGFTLSNIAMEVGVENGLNRVRAARKFGAS